MTRYQLHVDVEELEDGGYFAVCPDLQGCHAEGDPVADAVVNVQDVARVIIIELCREKGLAWAVPTVPLPSSGFQA